MKKPFKHTERDPKVKCDNSDCAKVRGVEGVTRQSIKKNVIARAPEGQTTFNCYDCQVHKATGMTRNERKKAEKKRRAEKESEHTQVMTAETI